VYISTLNIEGYKNCKEKAEVKFHKGLNILVGENASGKTTVINALRLILKENEFSYLNINEDDFYREFNGGDPLQGFKIDVCLDSLSEDEEVTFLTWCDADFNAKLHLEVNTNPNKKGYYKKHIWGGASKSSLFEEETFDYIDCIYLPPLRDAEEKLTNGKKSRLAKLLKKQYLDKNSEDKLVNNVEKFNNDIIENTDSKYNEIKKARNDINNIILSAMGEKFGQSINLQFADVSFNKILESIKMVFFPDVNESDNSRFRDIAINSLGYNNLLYIATVFAELLLTNRSDNLFTVLLIEEPEAHLHPQLQVKLIKHLEKLAEDNEHIQIIVTTHSPVLASSVNIDNLIHINKDENTIKATSLRDLNLGDSKNYINRWLDITKSTLLFSRGVILVEGISESMIIPELAKICLRKYNLNTNKSALPESLEEAGVSIININGINFKHFMKLFCNIDESDCIIKLPLRCAGITDNDPAKEKIVGKNKKNEDVEFSMDLYPKPSDKIKGENSAIQLIPMINKSCFARLYHSPLKTFEYDLAMEGNVRIMIESLESSWYSKTGPTRERCKDIIEKYNADDIQVNSEFIHKKVSDKKLGKGIFAQVLADKIKSQYNLKVKELEQKSSDKIKTTKEIIKIFNVPEYIYNAVVWACGGEVV
jgi:putative ATP-dependent endonuclease of OLD family